MKNQLLYVCVISSLLFWVPNVANAGQLIACDIEIVEDIDRNVRAVRWIHRNWVREREAERLRASGPFAGVSRYDRGDYCVIGHRENSRYSHRINKRYMMLNPGGRVPNCRDYTMRTRCYVTDPWW